MDTLFRYHTVAGFRLLHRGEIGRDDPSNQGNSHDAQRNPDKPSVPVIGYQRLHHDKEGGKL